MTQEICEKDSFNIKSFALLPTKYKLIGWILTIGAFFAFIIISGFNLEPEPARTFVRTIMLLGLFCVSLSRNQQEDERTEALRTQSFAWAFLFGIVYTLVMPYLDFGIDKLLGKPGMINDMTGFEVLSMLLVLQFAFYQSLKRKF